MNKKQNGLAARLFTSLLLGIAALASGAAAQADAVERNVTGLWEYTGLTTSGGEDLPLTGIFLFKDGQFLQQAVFNGEPFAAQPSMAHAGPYTTGSDSVHLVAAPTISIAPESETPLSYRESTEHDVAVTRDGEDLTLVFGSGTVQEFRRIGDAKGNVYALHGGALAFVDNYFLLVQADADSAVTGYGTFEKDGDDVELTILRWSEAGDSDATNRRDETLGATFDGMHLELADGRRFPVER